MNKKIRLFCIPYAGGNAEAFEELEMYMDDAIEVIPLEYAGHGTRRKEHFYESFEELQQDIIRQVDERREAGIPYALFGYSMGSVAAYAAAVKHEKDPCLKHVFLAAHEAPDVEWRGKKYADLDDLAFLKMLRELGGFQKLDENMLKNRFFRQLYFQPIREDYRLLADYHLKERRMLPVDTTVFYSPQDIPEESIHTWDRFAEKEIEYIALGDSHFFIRQYPKRMADIISDKLKGRE